MAKLPLVLPIVFAFSLGMTEFIRRHPGRGKLLDFPNHRSAHEHPVPRGGGLAIAMSFYLAMAVFYLAEQIRFEWMMSLAGGIAVAAIGFWDDHGHIPARWRILTHFMAAFWSLYWLGYEGWAILAGAFFLAWCLNLYNFMDGIDGLAGSEAVFISLALAFLHYPARQESAVAEILLACACLGFLVWNWPPARIFMGDVGSGFLGFLIGLYMLADTPFSSGFYAGLILFAVFVTDASVTLLRRFTGGEKWYEAHCSHAYQRIAGRYGHLRTVSAAMLINFFWLAPIAYLAWRLPSYALLFLTLAYFPLGYTAIRLGAGLK
ncbi:MAG: MraY family glycosyltransferase [Gammaproteobacteria bacterium]